MINEGQNEILEEWRSVPNFPGYEVSNLGHFRSYHKAGGGLWPNPRILKGWIRSDKYVGVALRKNGKTYDFCLHQLILEAFVGPCPSGEECRHLNGIYSDPRLENLKWGTRKENVADSYLHGTRVMGKSHPQTKLSDDDVREIRELKKLGVKLRLIRKKYRHISRNYFYDVANGKERIFI